ncbi:protealysin inhibitor emfourin [Bordetella sp. 2513F-2]
MITLPPLDAALRVCIRREGGLVHLPTRALPRELDLRSCPEPQRRAVCDALAEAAGRAGPGGGADQRYYHVEILFDPQAGPQQVTFRIPETRMPKALVQLWKTGH